LQSAYGQYQKGERSETGKQKGKAFIIRKPITDNLWEDHLNGVDPALGIIPINEHNNCKWGCIDIDQYNLNHKDLITKIRSLKLPLIVFRSKSGGAHIFLFTKEFITASLMQTTLKRIADGLGFQGVEIFPKQTEILVERGDTGNFLNLPYHNQTKGLRYAFDDNGAAVSLEEFYKLYDIYAQSKEEIEKIKIKEEKIEEAFKDGPPCLNRLAKDGFGEGSRNNALFNVAIYFKQSSPDTWQDKVVEANLKYMSPPLSNSEVQQLLKSIGKKGYDKYRCKLPPIVDVCNASLCRTKKFGIGGDEESVNNVPLHGKAYFGYGTGTEAFSRDVPVGTAGTTFRADNQYGAIARVPTERWYQEVVPASHFTQVKQFGKVVLDPGHVKTSVVSFYGTFSLNSIYRKLFDNDAAMLHTKTSVGTYRFMLLEKMILATTPTADNAIKVAYEVNLRMGCYATMTNSYETAQQNDLVNISSTM